MTLRELATRTIYTAATSWLMMGAGAQYGLAAELTNSIYDSGWATAKPAVTSPLGSGGVPIQQLLPGKVLDSLELSSPAKPERSSELGFRKPISEKTQPSFEPASQEPESRPKLEWRPALGKSGTPAGPSVDSPRIARAFELPPVTPEDDSAVAASPQADTQSEPETSEPDAFEEIFQATPNARSADEPAPFPGRTITIAPEPKLNANDSARSIEPMPSKQSEPSRLAEETTTKTEAPAELEEIPQAQPIDDVASTKKPVRQSDKASDQTSDNRESLSKQDTAKQRVEESKSPIAKQQESDKQRLAARSETKKSTADKKPATKKLVIGKPSKPTDEPQTVATPRRSLKDDLYVAPKLERAVTLKPLTRRQQYLRRRLRSVLSYYYRIPLNSRDHDPWEVMHGMLAYGLHSRVLDSSPRGEPITAVGYLCFNKPCKRQQMLYLTPTGDVDVRVGVGLQGHKGQLLAMLAQCGVSTKYPVRVEGKEFTVEDLIRAEQRTCYARTELTFKLIALMHYLQSDTTWVNDQGEAWDIPRLIADERTQKIRGAACGGTHRLSGLSLAVKKRAERGEPIDGEFAEAAKFVETYQNYAFRLQNSDGSMSTEWFRGPGDEEDINRRVRTTGHLLEWLVYSLPEEKLHYSRTVSAVSYLSNLLASNTDNPWEVGPLSHALHALLLYDQKVFQPYDNLPQVASNSKNGSRNTSRNGQRVQTAAKPAPTLIYHRISSKPRGSYTTEKPKPSDERDGSPLLRLFGGGRRSRR